MKSATRTAIDPHFEYKTSIIGYELDPETDAQNPK